MSLIIIYWVIIFLILYPYLVYPFLLRLAADLFSTKPQAPDEEHHPQVAVVISAFNEEKHIVDRVQNLLDQNYPAERLRIYIGSDGSSDKTVALLKSLDSERLKIFDYQQNRGKVSVLNDLLQQVQEPLVVFSDANTYYHPDAIAVMMKHFADPDIAGVCGELHLVDQATGSNQDGVYWRFEQFLKYHEGRLNAFLGANGAIYAIRTQHYQALPKDTSTDDHVIFMNLSIAGLSVRYDREAVAEEEVAPHVQGEYGRRVRIGLGNYQAFFRQLAIFNAKQKWRLFTYVSHKVIRWFTPHLMLLLLIINLMLLQQAVYLALFVVQLVLYTAAFIFMFVFKDAKLPAIARLLLFFIAMNFALGHGFMRYIKGGSQGAWTRTER